jgi:tetratricopeptide (TPR) repeat protein
LLIYHSQDGVTHKHWSYSKAPDTSLAPKEQDITQVDRSKALLEYGRFDEALSGLNPLPDAPEILEEALLQKSLALYHLRRYQGCWRTISECCQKYPKNTEAEILRSRVLDRLKELENGQYPFARMKVEALQVSDLDHATFMGPISIRMTNGRCHGLFTTASVKAGDHFLCEMAFAYLCSGAENIQDEADLVSMIVQKIRQNPSLETQIAHLNCKTCEPIIKKLSDGSFIVNL